MLIDNDFICDIAEEFVQTYYVPKQLFEIQEDVFKTQPGIYIISWILIENENGNSTDDIG